jgi:fructose-bisphosphate aldolase class I
MDKQFLADEAKKLTADAKGILAIDESMDTCNKRFEKLGVPTTEENRRKYRELLITTPNIENYVSGMITFDETIRQSTAEGVPFTDVFKQKGMSIGIKVDKGVIDFGDGEKVTQGLDGLTDRLKEYKSMGATFAKWRAVINIDMVKGLPTDECLNKNSEVLAEYASLCQMENIVPIVEPEVIMDGTHTLEDSFAITSRTLNTLFTALKNKDIYIPGTILKTSMVISGKDCDKQATTEEVAEWTLRALKENVPADIGGIVFLSGGQGNEQATDNLRAMHQMDTNLPWPLSFSYGRAIQSPALKIWAANMENIAEAQSALLEKAKANSEANQGK